MKGIQEYVTYKSERTENRDLLCACCYSVIKLDVDLFYNADYKCAKCGTVNTFLPEDKPRYYISHSVVKRPIRYWCGKFHIPSNSAYMAFRRRGIRINKNGIGKPNLMTEKKFLSNIVFTRHGQELIKKLIYSEWLLTESQIKNKI